MAKLTFTPIIFLFLLSFSHARTSQEIDVINNDLSNTLPQSNTRTTIILPTYKPDSEPVTVADNPEEILPDSDIIGTVNEPHPTHLSNSMTFQPINRHNRGKRQFALGVPLRRCRHGGGDIIISGEGGIVYPRLIQGDNKRQIPVTQVRLHHQHQRDEDGIQRFRLFKQQIFAKDKFERLFRHEEEIENRKERSQGGFVTRIRKFLNPK